MLRRLGYACLCLSLEHGSPRGTILRNASPERLRGLVELNLATLKRVIIFNVEHGVRLFRISSDVIPFGSHPVNTLSWWADFREPLREIGRMIREHDLRVSMHPGQYTVLSSPDTRILAAARADLVFHTRLLEALEVDTRHKLIIHVGGAYGDKEAALNRWIGAVRELPDNVRARVVVENDERLFGAHHVLRASAAAGTPVVLDVFHHRLYAGPAAERSLPGLIRRAAATWDHVRDGVPKLHYSSQAVGQRPGAHAEYVDPDEFARFLMLTPAEVQFDCMLEAKAKDRALFQLRQTLGIAA
ncbi:MAG: UV DNA damage repair endonuclease UvsE [Chloroflexota bacterium]|nr:UV DNA damage repair endonuclease UvsE [Chloroflexota bacterium]